MQSIKSIEFVFIELVHHLGELCSHIVTGYILNDGSSCEGSQNVLESLVVDDGALYF